MLRLSPRQQEALVAHAHLRGRRSIAAALAEALPDLAARAGERLPELVHHACQVGLDHGLRDALCVARLVACWAVWGTGFENRPGFEWAREILGDPRRGQGVKIFQLCRRTAELLASPQQPTPPLDRAAFETVLALLDRRLARWGELGALLPGPLVRLGEPCDLDAFDLRLGGHDWRRHYRLDGLEASRTAVPEVIDGLLLRQGPGGPDPAPLPALFCILSRPPEQGTPATLRLRTLAQASCSGGMHPLLQINDTLGPREWRGLLAADVRVDLLPGQAPAALAGQLDPPVAVAGSPLPVLLSLESCGLRAGGLPLGQVATQIDVYPAEQWLLCWERGRAPRRSWPGDGSAPPPRPAIDCRLERDGEAWPDRDWRSALASLDERLERALAALLLSWERTSGVVDGSVHAEPAVMHGRTALTWGWVEAEGRIDRPPRMRVQAAAQLVACELQLVLQGTLRLAGSVSRLQLRCSGRSTLEARAERGAADEDLAAALAPLKLAFRHPLDLELEVVAGPEAAVAALAGPVQGALTGSCGLRQRNDGPGLAWFIEIALEALEVPLRIHDPLLGVQERLHPLLPATRLLDWSLG